MSFRRLVLIAAIAISIGVAYYLTIGQASEACTVCISLRSRTRCATKSAGTAAEAAEGARRAACAELAPTDAGRATCFASPPTSVQCKTR
jgi:hypothetical protein